MTNIKGRILSLYRRVNEQAAEWRERAPLIDEAGFRILSAPPRHGKPMVVSFNPAWPKGIEHKPRDCNFDFWPERWPKCLAYGTGKSRFAPRITEVLQNAKIPFNGVNAGYVLMFRSTGVEEWKCVKRVPADVRKCAERLSLEVLTQIIQLLEPPFIYVCGWHVFRRMRCSPVVSRSWWKLAEAA